MPDYVYKCDANNQLVEVKHPIKDSITSWGDLCKLAEIDPGSIPLETPVYRRIFAPVIQVPTGNTKLKEMGFTKLVRRDKGVYENVTRSGTEKRYVKSGDPSSMPHLKKKIGD